MPRVYPNSAAPASKQIVEKTKKIPVSNSNYKSISTCGEVLTVWKKSLLFNCDGFTVFDGKGNLVFRVDNYCAANKAEIVLMDASGNSLLTIRRKRLSLSDSWLIYKGETTVNPILCVRKNINLLNSRFLAHVTNGTSSSSSSSSKPTYEIEGSYTRRCCKIYDENKKVVAEIKPKEAAKKGVAFGLDVFRLIVYPEMDSAISMALVILLDQMFGSSKRLHFN